MEIIDIQFGHGRLVPSVIVQDREKVKHGSVDTTSRTYSSSTTTCQNRKKLFVVEHGIVFVNVK